MATSYMIDWDSTTTTILLNPRMPTQQREHLTTLLQKKSAFKRHLWFATSGSTGSIKLVALSKEALLSSAHAVNHHLGVTSSDIWLNPLPDFHVGGMGIWARSYLSHSSIIALKEKWNPLTFLATLIEKRITLTAVVPTHVYDLVQQKCQAPPTLRGVIVGGGALPQELYQKAKQLNWPLLPSYGLTECSSQVATATLHSPELNILSHVETKINHSGYVCLKSPALLTTYAFPFEEGLYFVDPKIDGWLITEDRGAIVNDRLKILGRSSDFVKIGGESVDMRRLENLLHTLKQGDAALIALPDERLGHTVHLAHTEKDVVKLIETFNQSVLPFERIRKTHHVPYIPKSPLRKILKKELHDLLLSKRFATE